MPSLTNAQVRSRLHTAVDDLGTPGKDVYFGYDRINAYKALTGAEFQYHLRPDPYSVVIHLNTNPGGWLNGYDETTNPDAPILGFAEGGRFYFALDGICDECHTLCFIAGRVTTRDGNMIRTTDGTTYVGPKHIWLTPI